MVAVFTESRGFILCIYLAPCIYVCSCVSLTIKAHSNVIAYIPRSYQPSSRDTITTPLEFSRMSAPDFSAEALVLADLAYLDRGKSNRKPKEEGIEHSKDIVLSKGSLVALNTQSSGSPEKPPATRDTFPPSSGYGTAPWALRHMGEYTPKSRTFLGPLRETCSSVRTTIY